MKWLTKKLFISFILVWSTIVSVLVVLTKLDLCERGSNCNLVVHAIEPLGLFLFVPIAFLPIAIIFVFLKEVNYVSWKKFAIWAVPIVLILTYLVTRDTGGSNFFTMDFSLYFLAIIYGLFFFISLLVIGTSAWRNR